MSEIRKSIVISAPAAKVFAFVTSPENWTSYVTSLVEVKDLSDGSPAKGFTFTWVYKMMGVRFSGRGTVTEYSKNRKFGMDLKGRVEVRESYEFSPEADGSTRLDVAIDYEMPGQVLKHITNMKLVEKLNNLESRNVLEKIKTMCEAR